MSKTAAQASGLGEGFLKFNSMPPRLHVTSDDPEFDPIILAHWKQEGFDTTYLPYTGDEKTYRQKLARLPDELELGESFAIIGTK